MIIKKISFILIFILLLIYDVYGIKKANNFILDTKIDHDYVIGYLGYKAYNCPYGFAITKLNPSVKAPNTGVNDPTIYLVDSTVNRVIYSLSDIDYLTFGSTGAGVGQLSQPYGIEVTEDGKIYITEYGNDRVSIFQNTQGNISYINSFGQGQLKRPRYCALDSSGNIYVADTGNKRILKFDPNGNPVNSFLNGTQNVLYPSEVVYGITIGENDYIYASTIKGFIYKYSSSGILEKTKDVEELGIQNPDLFSLESDYYGNIYAVDKNNCQIHVFDEDLNYIYSFGEQGSGPNQFDDPRDIAILRERGTAVITEKTGVQIYYIGTDILTPNVEPIIFSPISEDVNVKQTKISYTLAITSKMNIIVKNSSGSEVKRILSDEYQGIGDQMVVWDGKGHNGIAVPEGDYTIMIKAKSAYGAYNTVIKNLNVTIKSPPEINIDSIDPQIIDPSHNESILNYSINEDSKVDISIERKVGDEYQKVISLEDDVQKAAGSYSINWDGKVDGNLVEDDIYYFVIEAVNSFGIRSDKKYVEIAVDFLDFDILNYSLSLPVINPNDNSFNSSIINYEITEQAKISINIYNSSTVFDEITLIKTLLDNIDKAKGIYNEEWGGENNENSIVVDGIYYIKISASQLITGDYKEIILPVRVDTTPPEISFILGPDFNKYISPDELSSVGLKDNTQIDYSISEDSEVVINVIKPGVGITKVLDQGNKDAGLQYNIVWDGKDENGSFADDFVYNLKIEAKDSVNNLSSKYIDIIVDNNRSAGTTIVYPRRKFNYTVTKTVVGNEYVKASGNVLLNGSFETPSGNMPLYWNMLIRRNSPSYSIVTDFALDGIRSFWIKMYQKGGLINGQWVLTLLEQYRTLYPGNNYVFEGWAKLKDVQSGGVCLGVWRDGVISLSSDFISGTKDWTHLTIFFNVPSTGSYQIKGSIKDIGEVWFDKFGLYTINWQDFSSDYVVDINNVECGGPLNEYESDMPVFEDIPENVTPTSIVYTLTTDNPDIEFYFESTGNQTTTDPDDKIIAVSKQVEYPANNLTALILEPQSTYSSIKDIVNIKGIVNDSYINNFKLEYGAGENPSEWITLISGNHNIINDLICAWDTTSVDNGIYKLKLTAQDEADNIRDNVLEVNIQNIDKDIVEGFKSSEYYVSINNLTVISYDLKVDASIILTVNDETGIVKTFVDSFQNAGLYQYSWDGSDLTDGKYIYKIKINFDSRTVIKEGELVVDNTLPVLSIDQPGDNTVVSENNIDIIGSVSDDNFTEYVLEYAPGSSPDESDFVVFHTFSQEINSSILGSLNVSDFNGLYSIRLKTTDKANNSSTATIVINIDHNDPVAEISSPNDNEVFSQFISIKGTAQDDNFNSYTLLYGEGEAPTSWQEIINSSTPVNNDYLIQDWDCSQLSGLYTIKLVVIDQVGHESVDTVKIFIDHTPPITTVIPTIPVFNDGNNNFANNNCKFALQADPIDEYSIVDHIEFNADAGSFEDYINPISFINEGLHTIEFKAVDNLGNWEALKTFSVIIDNTPPECLIKIYEPKFEVNDDIYIPVKNDISFDVNDYGLIPSGVKSVHYSIDGGQSWKTYGGEGIIITKPGVNEVQYYVVDNVDNTSITYLKNIILDPASPNLTMDINGTSYIDQDITYLNINHSIELSASESYDFDSGLALLEYKLNVGDWITYGTPIIFNSSGVYNFTYHAIDNVENETKFEKTICIDDSPPDVSISSSEELFNDLYAPISYNYFIEGSDDYSGIKEILININDSGWITYLDSINFNTEGSKIIKYKAVDNVDNESPEKQYSVIVDNSAPVSTLVTSEDLVFFNNNYYASLETIYSITAEDTYSGVNETYINIDNNGFQLYTTPFSFVTEGTHIIQFYSIDNLGIIEMTNKYTIITPLPDTTPPVTIWSIEGDKYIDDNQNVFINGSSKIILKAIDQLGMNDGYVSGVKAIGYSIDNSPFIIVTNTNVIVEDNYSEFSIDILLNEGIRIIKYYSYDVLENNENIKTNKFYVDDTPPLTEISFGEPKFEEQGALYLTSHTFMTLKTQDPIVNDVTSGVKYIEYKINNFNWTNYSLPFVVTGDDDTYNVYYRSTDNVNNLEVSNVQEVIIDNTPPAVPIDLTYFVHKSNIFLTWQPNTEWDLAGYNIFRNGAKLNSILLTSVVYKDISLPYGEYNYSVNAVDKLGNESEQCEAVSMIFDGCIVISNPQENSINRHIVLIWIEMKCRGEFEKLKIEYGAGYFPRDWELLKETKIKGNRKKVTYPWYTKDMNGIYTIRAKGIKKDHTLRENCVTIFIDNITPITKLQVNGIDYGDKDTVTILTNDSFIFNLDDPIVNDYASGIEKTLYTIEKETGEVIVDWTYWDGNSISLDVGEYVVKYYSIDKAGFPGDPPGLSKDEEELIGNKEKINITGLIVDKIIQTYLIAGGGTIQPNNQEKTNTDEIQSNTQGSSSHDNSQTNTPSELDIIPTQIIITGIENGKYYNEDVCFNVKIYDDNIARYYVVFKQNGEIKFSYTGSVNTNYTICTKGEAEYDLIVDTSDKSGNPANVNIRFGIDET